MSDSEMQQVDLKARADHEGIEIRVLDGDFQEIAYGQGQVEASLDPGIYKVRATMGTQAWEKLVVLSEGQRSLELDIPPLEFPSPVPLPGTTRSHEFHYEAAVRESRRVHIYAGEGSAIFLFARRWTPPDAPSPPPAPVQHPARGLTLLDAAGSLVADLAADGTSDLTAGHDPWAACNVMVDPGFYRLRLELPDIGPVEQTVVATPGWQTKIWTLQRRYGRKQEDERADLPGASILYVRFEVDPNGELTFPASADPESDRYVRLAEVGRLALINRRAVLKREVKEMLWAKHSNPMLGIYGAHLLLLDKEPDLNLLREVVRNLRRLLGEHPDVEALALRLQDTAYVFDVPPMLRRSWSLVQEASFYNPDLVPLDSLSMEVSQQMWGDGAWHQWQQPADALERTADVAFFDSVVELESQSPMLSGSQEFLVAQLEMATEPLQQRGRELPEPKIVADIDPSLLEPDEKTLKHLMRVLGMPRAGVEAELEQLRRKARRYEVVRAEMPPGWDRTERLEKIVAQARDSVSQLDDVTGALQGLIADNAEGSRITALGLLEAQPDAQFFPFVLDAIGYSRSAFEQYHALIAAREMVPLLSADQRQQLAEVLKAQRKEGRGRFIQPNSDRWLLSSWILENLS